MTIQTFNKIYDGCPCDKCLVQSACSKSEIDGSACEAFKRFIFDLVIEANPNLKYRYKDEDKS